MTDCEVNFCNCDEGYERDENGVCIPKENCPCMSSTEQPVPVFYPCWQICAETICTELNCSDGVCAEECEVRPTEPPSTTEPSTTPPITIEN